MDLLKKKSLPQFEQFKTEGNIVGLVQFLESPSVKELFHLGEDGGDVVVLLELPGVLHRPEGLSQGVFELDEVRSESKVF